MQNVAFIPMQYFLFPETKGMSLEEIDHIFLKREMLPEEEGDASPTVEPKKAEHVEEAEREKNIAP
jgi:hypothetical protein